MKIDRKLNLVIPVESDDGSTFYVHAMPFSDEFWMSHYLLIAKVFSSFASEGLGALAAPRVAALMLNDIATKSDAQASAAAIMNEIRRLTHVMLPGNPPILLQEAVDKGLIVKADLSVLENAIVFFTVSSAMHRPPMLKVIMEMVCSLWNAQISSLGVTDFLASLQTSTGAGNTGGTATA